MVRRIVSGATHPSVMALFVYDSINVNFFWSFDNIGNEENNAITDGCVAPLTMLLTIVIMYHKILSF